MFCRFFSIKPTNKNKIQFQDNFLKKILKKLCHLGQKHSVVTLLTISRTNSHLLLFLCVFLNRLERFNLKTVSEPKKQI